MPDTLNPTTKLAPVPDLDVHLLEDEMVIYQPPHDMMVSLNRSARAIWELCDGQRSVAEIAALLAQELALSATEQARLERDVQATIIRLHEAGVLAVAP